MRRFQICQKVQQNNSEWTVEQPCINAVGPYAYSGNQWVAYDDIMVVKAKARFVLENNLGGLIFW